MLVFFLFAFPLLVQGIVQKCNELRIEKDDNSYGYGKTEFSATVKLSKDESTGITTVTVSNYSYVNTFPNADYPSQYCINADLNNCNSSEFGLTYATSSPSVSLYARLNNDWSYLYFGYIDDGTLSAPNGSLFTPEKPTYFTNNSNINSYTSERQTCVSFTPAPAMINPNALRCKKFTTKTTIFNTTQNNALFASTTVKFAINPGYMILNGTANLPHGYVFLFRANNGEEECDSDRGYNCYFSIRSNTEKFVFYGTLRKQYAAPNDIHDIPMIGRMILRNGQTLMKEGTPFSPSNNCEYFESDFSETQVSKSQICCTDFGL